MTFMLEGFIWWAFFTLKEFERAFRLLRDNLSFWNPIKWGACLWLFVLESFFYELNPHKLARPAFIETGGVFYL